MKNSTLALSSKILMAFAFVALVSSTSIAQVANDDCANAISITYATDSTSCVPTAGNSTGATQSADPADVCSASWFDDDVWFSFTTPMTMPSAVVVRMSFNDSIVATDIVNPGMAIYAGCGNTELAIGCFSGGNDRLIVTSLAANTVYYVRCWSDNTNTPNGGTFEICAFGDNSISSACAYGTLNTPGPLFPCPGDISEINTTGSDIPTLGGMGYRFDEGINAGGGLAGGFTLTGAPEVYTFDEDLNGVMSGNGLGVLVGQWIVTPVIYSDANNELSTLCDSSAASVTVNFLSATDPACDGVGISENSFSDKIELFPNPTSGILNLDTQVGGVDAMKVVSLDGKIVRDFGAIRFTSSTSTLDLSDLEGGAYLLQFSKDGEQGVKRFMIAK